MEQPVIASRQALLVRLSVVLFLAELAHGMLLYGIIPDLVQNRFPPTGLKLFGFIPLKEEMAALCLAVYTLSELGSKLPAGHWVDHKGPDVPLRVGLAVSLLSVPLLLLSRDPHLMLLGSLLHGIGGAPIWPAVISSWTRGRSSAERGAIMGQILTGWMAGLGLGVIAGKFLVALTGRAELIASFTPVLMWAVTLLAAVWSGHKLGVPNVMAAEEGEEIRRGPFPPELRVMAIGLFLQNMAFGALILPFNFLAERQFFLNPAQVGLVFLLGGGPAVLLLSPMGKIADRVGKRNAVIGSMFVVAPLIAFGPFLAYFDVNPWVRLLIMIPGLLLAGVAYAFMLPAWHALALGRIPQEQRGRSLAILMSVEMAALAAGHAIGTPIYTKVAFYAPFLMAGAVFAILAGLYLAGRILPPETHDEVGH